MWKEGAEIYMQVGKLVHAEKRGGDGKHATCGEMIITLI